MADVVICYSRENGATVRQLAEALTKAGYDVWRDETPEPTPEAADEIAEQIGRAKAVVVVWSEAAVASEWVKAEANVARGMKKLVQATADDHLPPVPFNAAQVAPISDWMGEPSHPGWQQILSGITALAPPVDPDKTVVMASLPPAPPPGAAAAPSAAAEPDAAATLAAPAPAPPPASPATPIAAPTAVGGKSGKGVLVAIVAVLLLALLGSGYWAWQQGMIRIGGGGGDTAQGALTSTLPGGPPEQAPQVQPAQPAPAPVAAPEQPVANEMVAAPEQAFTQESVVRNGDGFALVRSAPDGGGLTVARINNGEVFTTYPQEGNWWRIRTTGGVVGYMLASNIRSRAQVAAEQRVAEERRRRPTGPRISRENSEVMVAFCQNAGRGTPQCRRFRQQVRDQRQ